MARLTCDELDFNADLKYFLLTDKRIIFFQLSGH